ncbi:hypothetical protein M5K25_023903 [Dendrobium thyrsiflorum]|uniref:Uncharacterized protein n=1 Tax=Dendrobium thyrsiflorum TaxID=117978 RepID=A0ABD0U0E9_DENTH
MIDMANEEEDQQQQQQKKKNNDEEFFEIELEALNSIPLPVYYEHRLRTEEARLANCLIPITTLRRAIPMENFHGERAARN